MIKVFFCCLLVNLFVIYVNGDAISPLFDYAADKNIDLPGKVSQVVGQNRGNHVERIVRQVRPRVGPQGGWALTSRKPPITTQPKPRPK